MTPQLNWKQDYRDTWSAQIFLNCSLVTYYNGENWYNVGLFDKNGNKREDITGTKTVEQAKANALSWITNELTKVTT